MVAGLEVVPVLTDALVFNQTNALAQAVEFVDSLLLKDVTHPRAGVACFIGPRNGVHYRQLAHWLEFRNHLTWGHKLDALLSRKSWQSLHELKDTALARLQLAKGLIVHKQVDEHLLLGQSSNPVDVLVGSERIGSPLRIAEAEGDIVAKLRVLEQEFEFWRRCCLVEVVRRLPSQDVLSTLGYGSLEPHRSHNGSDVVVIDKLGVAEHLGTLAKELVNLLVVRLHLSDELFSVDKRRERVSIGLAEELHATSVG